MMAIMAPAIKLRVHLTTHDFYDSIPWYRTRQECPWPFDASLLNEIPLQVSQVTYCLHAWMNSSTKQNLCTMQNRIE